jgi:ABC-type branched-subunit amino acid transport system ATPase component
VGAVVTVRDVRHRRGGRDVLAIEQLDLEAGERLAVLGPNGAGKTTLLRLLAGLEAPTSGRVEIDGEPIAGAAIEVRRQVGYATQRSGLLSTSVIRNVELPLSWRRMERAARRAVALAALERLNVAGLADRKAASLSGGEAQRVSLARALAIDPRLLLLDEPAAGLNVTEAAHVSELIARIRAGGTTVILVEHHMDVVMGVSDEITVLNYGRRLAHGTPAQIQEDAGVIEAYLGRSVESEHAQA